MWLFLVWGAWLCGTWSAGCGVPSSPSAWSPIGAMGSTQGLRQNVWVRLFAPDTVTALGGLEHRLMQGIGMVGGTILIHVFGAPAAKVILVYNALVWVHQAVTFPGGISTAPGVSMPFSFSPLSSPGAHLPQFFGGHSGAPDSATGPVPATLAQTPAEGPNPWTLSNDNLSLAHFSPSFMG